MKTTKATREGKETAQARAVLCLVESLSTAELTSINRKITSELAKRSAKDFQGKAFLSCREAGVTTNRHKIDDSRALTLYVEPPINEAIGAHGARNLSCQDSGSFERVEVQAIPEGWPVVHAYIVKVALGQFAKGIVPAVTFKGAIWQACKRFADPLDAWAVCQDKVPAAYLAQKVAAICAAGFVPQLS